ncbi:unnamed protein product, partial [Vitis vinifera]
MASTFLHLLLCSILLSVFSPSLAQTSFRPKALVLPVSKDAASLQYITHINQRTHLVSIPLTLDLGGQFLWVDCDQGYVSSSYRPVLKGCNYSTCVLSPDNTVTGTATSGEVGEDAVSIQSTDGSNPGRVVSVRRLLFTCGSTFLLEGLASRVKGMAGLGRSRVALPSQFSSAFSFNRKFSICLSSSTKSTGVVFFGDGPYHCIGLFSGRGFCGVLHWSKVSDNVLCLGFVDGGVNPRTSIVIGGRQLEDNLLQFDLATSRLGFSSSLLSRQTTCSNFNFTSNA